MAIKKKKVSRGTAKKRKPSILQKPRMSKEEQRWQAESDVSTLMQAEKIKNDRGRMMRAKQVANQQAKEAAKVAGKLSTPKPKQKTRRKPI